MKIGWVPFLPVLMAFALMLAGGRFTLDAAALIYRGGLDILLTLYALGGFLKKAGQAGRTRGILLAAGSGVLFSAVMAALLCFLAERAPLSADTNVLAGWAALVGLAAALSLGVRVHGEPVLAAWRHRLSLWSSNALAAGRFRLIPALAFLAVVRDGAETALLVPGLALSADGPDFAAGLTAGTCLLGATAMFLPRLPDGFVRPLSGAARLLTVYLSLSLIGLTVYRLQAAGVLKATPADGPSWLAAICPHATLESLVSQGVLLLSAAAVYYRNRKRSSDFYRQVSV